MSLPADRRRLRGPVFAFAGIGVGAALAFTITVVISRETGAAGVGQFFQFVAVFSVATAVLTFGGDTGLVRFLAADRAVSGGRGARSLLHTAGRPVALITAIAAGALLVLYFLPIADQLVEYLTPAGLLVGGPFLMVACLMALMLGALRGLGRLVEFTALQNIALPVLRLGTIAAVLAAGASVEGLLVAWLVPLLVVAALAALLLARSLPHRTSVASAPERLSDDAPRETGDFRFWNFASARGVSSVLEMLLEWVDVLAVALLLGPQAAGVYAVVTRCVRVGQMVDHAVRTVSSPLISSSFALGDTPRTARIFTLSGRVLVLLAWPFYMLLIVHAPTILALFGSEFTGGVDALRIICGAMLIAITAGGVQSMLLMGGRSQWQIINKTVALAVAVVANITLIPVLGIAGAAAAWAAAVLVDTALASFQVSRRMGIRLPIAVLRRPALLALGAFALPLVLLEAVLPAGILNDALGTGLAATVFLAAVVGSRRAFDLRQNPQPAGPGTRLGQSLSQVEGTR